ncbi:hypothetical protein BD410DRAFT_791213 [Rickenella mellea]|uniref:Uncharacterized protein n=1 Tax=Rickenella mellea TaxID=50990 RepID=A0A4Y7PXK8_9AGAM|nr:hypothetical protein BD410DRAFT_791213 [Rickenella mellea]
MYFLDFVFEQTGHFCSAVRVFNSDGLELEPAGKLLNPQCTAPVYGIAAEGTYRLVTGGQQTYRIVFDPRHSNPRTTYYIPRVGFETVTETYFG